jgi:PKD repeat protein/V8-like Glu-specific endopeptidase
MKLALRLKVLVAGAWMVVSFNIQAQISVADFPESLLLKTKASVIIPQKLFKKLNKDSLLFVDSLQHLSNRYGILQSLSVDIKNEGVKTEINGKGTIWRYKVKSANAYSLGIHFKYFHVPDGAKVFIYNEDHSMLMGAFTSKNNNPENQLYVAEFKGQNAIIEYFEPINTEFSGTLNIGDVSLAYKDIQSILNNRIGINCPEGANWQDEKHAVCKITFRENSGSYYCTGFLVNNVKQDGTPYFLTASHCIDNKDVATTMVTYFNDELLTCPSTDTVIYSKTLSGSVLKATNSKSDFTLLLLDDIPPDTYTAYYAGWDVSERAPKSGTCIHHPGAAPKCIAIDSGPPITYPTSILWIYEKGIMFTSAGNTHWRVLFDVGNIEQGSSGAPLFDDNKRVIGQLHGGNDNASFFGKLSISWNESGIIDKQLLSWLDPDFSGTQFINGDYFRFKPKAAFSTVLTNVCTGTVVKLKDKSKYHPSEWDWDIAPSGFRFVNGTTRNSPNPEVIFDSIGTYSVSLIAKNNYDADTISLKNYFVVDNHIHVSMSNIPIDSIWCGHGSTTRLIKASGALSYNFSVEKINNIGYTAQSDSLILSLKPHDDLDGPYDSWVKVTGTFGSCISSDSAHLRIVYQPNDDIKNAIMLKPGKNGEFNNLCASVQVNEPHPPLGGCYTDTSKCFSSGEVIKNTLWFTFTGPQSGKITIDTHGFENRMAVYDPEYFVNENTYYRLIAANEGRSNHNGTAIIENLPVEPGKIYYLQMDGLHGKTGICTIDLYSNSLEINPNPSNGQFDAVISTDDSGKADIEIYSLIGKLMFKKSLYVTQDNKHFPFDLSVFPRGMYVMKASMNGFMMKSKLMIIK